MNRLFLASSVFLVMLGGTMAPAQLPQENADNDEVMEIPLDQIWALRMPGTKDVRELDPNSFGKSDPSHSPERALATFQNSKVVQIQRALMNIPTDAPQKKAFFVRGDEEQALQEVFEVLVRGEQPTYVFSTDDKLWLVFFSARFGAYVQLDSIERTPTEITIKYRFSTHSTLNLTEHFAIIPVGKLAPGERRVVVERVGSRPPSDKKSAGRISPEFKSTSINPSWNDKVVCGPFEFTVTE